MAKHKPNFWTYLTAVRREFADPRIAIARQIGWQKYTGPDSIFSVPEPDNYNRAVVTEKPIECKFVEDQVIYKDTGKNGWICVMLVADEQIGEYQAWLERLRPLAHWQHSAAPKVKKYKIY